MHLVTTALRECWPDKGEIWLLSAGCFPNPDDSELKGRWEVKGIVTNPFPGDQELTVAYAEILDITHDLIRLLTNRLNHIHHTDRSERYWRTHIGFWTLLFVTVVYDRHSRLLKARQEIVDVEVVGCKHANSIVPLDTADFLHEAGDDPYNWQIYLFLCRKLGISVVDPRPNITEASPQRILDLNPSPVRTGLKSFVHFCYNALSPAFVRRADVLMVASYLPRWVEMALAILTGGKVVPLHAQTSQHVRSNSPTNDTARAALSVVPEGYDGVRALAIELVKICLPRSFVEDYPDVCSRSDCAYKGYRPKAIYSATAWWFDESFKHWAAQCQEQGTKLIGGAHGSCYFVRKHGNLESFEVLLSDHYLTWGWSEAVQPKLVPAPACKLIDIDMRPNRISGDGILFCATANERYSVAYLPDFFDELDWQKRFIAAIPEQYISKLLIRLHYLDYGWNIKERLVRVVPTLRFDSWQVSFRGSLRSRRIFVCDNLNTTYAEGLSANVPTVLFWNESSHPSRATAAPHVQALKDCRILHDTPESAAAWVAEVYDDPAPWWLGGACQKARKEFCYLYARTSVRPLRDWKRMFEELVSD